MLFSHSAVASNGYIYTTGGYGTAVTSTVRYAQINIQGKTADEGWQNKTPLPSTLDSHSAVASNGYLYVTGGCSNSIACIATATSTVLYAPVSASGTVGAWANATSLPSVIYQHSAAAYNGYLYVTGGISTTVTSTVRYAQILSGGSLGSWQNATSLPSVLYSHSAVAYNGYLYTMGGYSTAATSTVFYAPINSNGSLGSWTNATSLPSVLGGHSAAASNGYLYVVAGRDVDDAPTSTVSYAPFQSDGSLGSWKNTTALPPTALSFHSVVAYNGYLYMTGGENADFLVTSTVRYTQIRSDGSLGNWLNATALPSGAVSHSAAAYNGYVYTMGGLDAAGAATSSVQSIGLYTSCTPFTTPAGGYVPSGSLTSVIIDTSITGGIAPNSLTWEGSQPANTTVKFQFAASNATSGPWGASSYVAWNPTTNSCDSSSYYTGDAGTPVEIKAACHQNKRYIRYKAYLETSDSAFTPRVERVILNYAK
jgi:N-acetylneuraminic acid mutarotase